MKALKHTIRHLAAALTLIALLILATGLTACSSTGDPAADIDNLGEDLGKTLPGLGPGSDPKEQEGH